MNVYEEFILCQKDFNYFTENYVKITHPKKGIIPLVLHDYQKRLIKSYENNRYNIGLKFRQGGFTTVTTVYLLWLCMFKQDQKVFIAGRTDREAIYIGKIIENIISLFPDWLKPKMSRNNMHEKYFETTGNKIFTRTIEACCGVSVTHLFIDEAAYITDMENKWKMIHPTIATGGKVIILSTVNSAIDWFANMYRDSIDGKNNFKAFSCSYLEHPDFSNPEFTKTTKENLGEKNFLKEFMCQFLSK